MTASANPPPIATELLAWYDRHARDLPWRAPPGTAPPDPYRVWLSEIMLQQTTVAAVKPYFAAFTQRWPSVDQLAGAKDEEVMAAWAGLGYYSRARNLLKAARLVAARGGFPDTEAGLRELPGVGDYTAAAIAAIAFERRAVAVDANVIRVVTRLFAIDTPLPGAKREIAVAADSITPGTRAGDFAQAMMDLGSSICTTRAPKCLLCPLAEHCAGRVADPERFPVKPPKKAKPLRQGRCFWIEREGQVLLVERAGKGMLGGMRALPDDGWSAKGDGNGEPPLPGEWETRGLVRHGFTHFDIELEMLERVGGPPGETGNGSWYPVAEIETLGLPTLFLKAARRVLAARQTA
ncbi:A/G-specific adenine glycosylase [Erythrobacter sp. LQ02-29]|uniref:A/G-specific adenine glycosylase n=1 Tax=Erythrobacter sp. LQ02-29 TaxID=2920384 RepID=UPI001F4D915C|nr:A/G-specific adenine glycosylase [Erythrobacter sp. LQ02-29]